MQNCACGARDPADVANASFDLKIPLACPANRSATRYMRRTPPTSRSRNTASTGRPAAETEMERRLDAGRDKDDTPWTVGVPKTASVRRRGTDYDPQFQKVIESCSTVAIETQMK